MDKWTDLEKEENVEKLLKSNITSNITKIKKDGKDNLNLPFVKSKRNPKDKLRYCFIRNIPKLSVQKDRLIFSDVKFDENDKVFEEELIPFDVSDKNEIEKN